MNIEGFEVIKNKPNDGTESLEGKRERFQASVRERFEGEMDPENVLRQIMEENSASFSDKEERSFLFN